MKSVFNISGWFVPLARRVLYAWVRTTVFSESAAGIDSSRPVCYVLQDRHLSNLLVLFEESRRAGLPRGEAPLAVGAMRARRSVFFLHRRHDGLRGPCGTSRSETSSRREGFIDIDEFVRHWI